jgi:hypothetical protein
VSSVRRTSTPRAYHSAAEWPAWTDEVRFELGPDPADAQWAAENLNDTYDFDGPIPDDVLDLLADEAAFAARCQDLLDQGFCM